MTKIEWAVHKMRRFVICLETWYRNGFRFKHNPFKPFPLVFGDHKYSVGVDVAVGEDKTAVALVDEHGVIDIYGIYTVDGSGNRTTYGKEIDRLAHDIASGYNQDYNTILSDLQAALTYKPDFLESIFASSEWAIKAIHADRFERKFASVVMLIFGLVAWLVFNNGVN